MEVYRIDKVIDNEKLDLELSIGQLKKEQVQISPSLKRRKALVVKINENLYTEDIYPERDSGEANEGIKDILENISNLQEEVRNLKRG